MMQNGVNYDISVEMLVRTAYMDLRNGIGTLNSSKCRLPDTNNDIPMFPPAAIVNPQAPTSKSSILSTINYIVTFPLSGHIAPLGLHRCINRNCSFNQYYAQP